MKNFLLTLNILLSIWLIYISGISHINEINLYQITTVFFSGLLLIINIILLKASNKYLFFLVMLISILLFSLSFILEQDIKWQVLIGSALIFFMLLAALRLRSVSKNFILHAHDGAVLMEVKKLEYKDSKLVVRGKMMGTMPTTAHMYPDELWKALTMISLKVFLSFPKLIYLGWKSAKKVKN